MESNLRIYLASASSRRKELLKQLGVAFDVLPSNIPEVQIPGESPAEYVRRVAADKARWVARRIRERGLPDYPVLGADTEVVLDGEILGKPENATHGRAMLQRLSGRAHEVLSGICVRFGEREFSELNSSRVTFRPLTEAEIAQYWESGEPQDKAGAYAIQGRAAGFITKLEGSYSGVMGLPLYELSDILKKISAGSA